MPALKGVPSNISPDLMHVLMSMGHGDEIVLADGNFPAASHAKHLVRADGQSVPQILEAIMKFLPLDNFVKDHAVVMEVVPGRGTPNPPPIWSSFQEILSRAEGSSISVTPIERHQFYERAKRAYAVVATSETAIYANLILKKGVIMPDK